jgi:isochorismate synthase
VALELQESVTREEWHSGVEAVLAAIEAGEAEKVVLARTLRAVARRPFDVNRVLVALARRYPHCTVFAHAIGRSCFVGATPERLLRLTDGAVQVDCLAGSVRRGANADEAALLAEQLLADAKERHEHAVVVRAIVEALRPLSEDVTAPQSPAVISTADVQHLHTPVAAVAHAGASIFDFVRALHPTPATGGYPREAALQRIAAIERFDRGWYAGPIGWLDAAGNGEVAVALRSALVEGETATLYAGAGIVAGSDPGREFDETGLKMKAMLWALQQA